MHSMTLVTENEQNHTYSNMEKNQQQMAPAIKASNAIYKVNNY